MPRFLLLTWGEAGEACADGGHHLVSLPRVHAQLHVLIGTLNMKAFIGGPVKLPVCGGNKGWLRCRAVGTP